MAEKKTPHVHKFKRLIYKSGNAIFFCALPDCAQKINISLALGKRSICWRCGEEFIMNEYSLRLAKPHCDNCHKPKKIKLENGSTISLTRTVSDSEKYVGQDEVHESTKEEVESYSSSLADRLEQTIKQAQKEVEEEI